MRASDKSYCSVSEHACKFWHYDETITTTNLDHFGGGFVQTSAGASLLLTMERRTHIFVH